MSDNKELIADLIRSQEHMLATFSPDAEDRDVRCTEEDCEEWRTLLKALKLLEAADKQVEPVAWMAFGKDDHGDVCPLPEYAANTELGVAEKVRQRAWQNEGYQGTAGDRMRELGWWSARVYAAMQSVTDS